MDRKQRKYFLSWFAASWIGLVWWLSGGIAFASGGLQETAPPPVIAQLATAATGSPRVDIVSPRPDEIVNTNNVPVSLQVQGVSIFKNATFGLGPHLHLLLDRTHYQSVYDLSQPLTLNNLTPGTHTLQILVVKPWHESWKNPEALAQVTFHVLGKSAVTAPVQLPTLVYNQPGSTYGAEPFLLDFYLTNAPSHLDGQQRQVNDWRVRATINNQSFEIDRWQPFYLKGLQPGANLIKLEYLNAQGQPLDAVLRVVNYQPQGTDGFSQLLRNEIPLSAAVALFDVNSNRPVTLLPAAPPLQATPAPQMSVAAPPVYQLVPTVVPTMPVPIEPLLTNPAVVQSPFTLQPIPLPTVSALPVQPPITTPDLAPPSSPAPPPAPPIAMASPVPQPLQPDPIVPPVQPPALSPSAKTNGNDDVMEFKVLAREFGRTASVRIKEFTNSIPPTVAKWSQNFSHWIGDRMQAMHSGQKTS